MEDNINRPIPKPRRLVSDITKSQYENVTIDIINKNINIKDENIQSEAFSKVPNNKIFIHGRQHDDDNSKCILTATNQLINADKNQNVQNAEKSSNIIRPIPAPRRSQESTAQDDIYENTTSSNVSPRSTTTGAVSKSLNSSIRKAPDIPKKLNNEPRIRSISIDEPLQGLVDPELRKSISNSTISSSISSTSSNDNQKYKSASPSDLLKTLGTTSRLLTEAITERVTAKAKGAKHKLDKNIKSSQDKIANWGFETTDRLKSVRKRINNLGSNNSSISREDKKAPEFNPDRPQTVPPNDHVFQSITFESPLNKAKNVSDLSNVEHSYEIPRNTRKTVCSTIIGKPPPTYEEVIETKNRITTASVSSLSLNSSGDFERNTPVTKSLVTPRITKEAVLSTETNKNNSEPNLNKAKNISVLAESKMENDSISCSSIDEDLPMPDFPAPSLPKESIYGKLKDSIEPPMRHKRKKHRERLGDSSQPSSTRATIDPTEFRQTFDSSSRDVSTEIKKVIKAHEKILANPSRSDSWTYYDRCDDDNSSPEPIYANQEPTYGKICEMESDDMNAFLTPQTALMELNIPLACHANLPSSSSSSSLKNVGTIDEPLSSNDILHEFDPLIGRNLSSNILDKSNQLILLENLFSLETYGTLSRDAKIIHDEQEEESIESSDEENSNVAGVPPPPIRSDSLDTPKKTNDIQIIHQNPKLPSGSVENLLTETTMESYLAKVDEGPKLNTKVVDLSKPMPSQTNWFVDNRTSIQKNERVNPFNKLLPADPKQLNKSTKKNLTPAPPSYSEAMATTTTSITISGTKYPVLPSPPEAQQKSSVKSMFSNVLNKMESLKRKTSFRGQKSDVHVIIEMIPKPTLSQQLVMHEGHLIRLPCGGVEDILKEMQTRKAILRDRKFQTFLDKEMKNQKETFPLEHITTIQCVSNHKYTTNAVPLYCFEISIAAPKSISSQQVLSNPNMVITNNNSGNNKTLRSCHLYGVGKESDRDIWMQKLLESLTNVFPRSSTCQYYRAGWCYLKKSISSEWAGTWLLLQKRKRRILFYSVSDMNLEKLDLRKARCIGSLNYILLWAKNILKENDDSINNLHVESGPLLTIDCPPFTLYLMMSSPRETKIWRHIIREVAHNNGPCLNEQQLTKYNVPVLVDKCVNFIYIHGSMSEGIYRKSGSENSIQKLVHAFRTDAFNVEITRNDYNEHDVANVLKRFMRDLPQRLLGKYWASFMGVSALESKTEKITAYKELLGRLPEIEYQTLRKLIGHLAFIQSQKSKNKMGVENLAIIWGPTLLQDKADEMSYSQKEADVISDLIVLYKNLYQLSKDEVVKEQAMLAYLQKYYAAAENLPDAIKKSGDLKVWINICPDPKAKLEDAQQINVTLTPTKTALDVCRELAQKIKKSAHNLTLSEVILNDTLERPLHHNERLFDIVIRWSYWPESDRKNNYLVLKPIKFLNEVQRALKNLATMTPGKELKFADNKTKSLKSYHLELNEGKITVLKKDKNSSMILKEIHLSDVNAYLGCEKKRDFSWRWAITLVEHAGKKVLRSRDSPFIGHVIAGTEYEDQIIWFSSIWYSLYRDDVMPPAEIVIP